MTLLCRRDLVDYLAELDRFIENTIKTHRTARRQYRFFDHRRTCAPRLGNHGLTAPRMEALLTEARRRPKRPAITLRGPWEDGGPWRIESRHGVISEHLAAKGLGLHNDLQNEHSLVQQSFRTDVRNFATEAQFAM